LTTSILKTEKYTERDNRLPESGRHILAHFDDDSIVVYQAYRPAIGHYAASHGYFGGPFSFSRMTWIKPNFLWMMYRSKWGTKIGQKVILAITLKRNFFDKVVAQAVPALFRESNFKNQSDWKKSLAKNPIRVQWDPDRNPYGHAISRRAIQLGLKGDIVKEYAQDATLQIEDISEFVQKQYRHVQSQNLQKLIMPVEHVYVADSVSRK